MQNTKKIKKLNRIYLIFTILFVVLISFGIVIAVNHFLVQKEEKVPFEKLPQFTVEKVNNNNSNKSLLVKTLPILDDNKQVHEFKIQHKAKLSLNGGNLKKPLYLKISGGFMDYDSTNKKWVDNNIVNTKTDIQLTCSGSIYNDEQKPQFKNNSVDPEIIVDYIIQQKDIIIEKELPSLQCTLVSQYELVDKDGNALEGSKVQIQSNLNKIS